MVRNSLPTVFLFFYSISIMVTLRSRLLFLNLYLWSDLQKTHSVKVCHTYFQIFSPHLSCFYFKDILRILFFTEKKKESIFTSTIMKSTSTNLYKISWQLNKIRKNERNAKNIRQSNMNTENNPYKINPFSQIRRFSLLIFIFPSIHQQQRKIHFKERRGKESEKAA